MKTLAIFSGIFIASVIVALAQGDPVPVTTPAPPPQYPYQYPYPPVPSDNWTPGMVVLVITTIFGALGTLITGIVVAVSKARQEANSRQNNEAIKEVHREVLKNTVETVKGSGAAATAADQAKVRVEELTRVVEKLPLQKSETEEPTEVQVVNPPENPVNTKPQ